jgi:hypothetical protein
MIIHRRAAYNRIQLECPLQFIFFDQTVCQNKHSHARSQHILYSALRIQCLANHSVGGLAAYALWNDIRFPSNK